MVRVHDDTPIADLQFGLEVRPIGEVAGEALYGEFGDLGKSFFKKITSALTKVHRAIYHATVPGFIRKQLLKVGKQAKKQFIKLAPFIAIAAQILNFIPGLGVVVGLAIMAGATAISIAGGVMAKQEAKKTAKKEEAAAAAQEAAQEAEDYKEAGAKADEAYAKGAQQLFIPKYGMTQDKWSKLTSKDKVTFLNGVVFDAHPDETAKMGVTRADFNQMLPEEQVLLLAKLGGAGEDIFDESSPLTYVAIGATALAIILVVYVVTRKKRT